MLNPVQLSLNSKSVPDFPFLLHAQSGNDEIDCSSTVQYVFTTLASSVLVFGHQNSPMCSYNLIDSIVQYDAKRKRLGKGSQKFGLSENRTLGLRPMKN
jgi:hypothetical protein